jgi:hypothetical protein
MRPEGGVCHGLMVSNTGSCVAGACPCRHGRDSARLLAIVRASCARHRAVAGAGFMLFRRAEVNVHLSVT